MHGGAHKLNNTLGQALVAKKMGKTRLIAETGAGQHGVATAIVGANLGFETQIYMGEVDIERQKMNVYRMQLMGAEVIPGALRLSDPQGRHQRGHAGLGRQLRAHPLSAGHGGRRPSLSQHGPGLSERHRPRGQGQILQAEGRLPDSITACVGGGSNAMGIFAPFLQDERRAAHGRGGRRAGPGQDG